MTGLILLPLGCKSGDKAASSQAKKTKPALHINPNGTNGVAPVESSAPPELKKVFDYIDAHIDDHVENLQKWIQQPSISNSGEGIPESAEMVKGFFDKLGCQTTRVYDVGITEYGSPGNPVVYAKCDEGAPKTVAIYWQYDTMPVTQPDAWVQPPFEGNIIPGAAAGVPDIPRVLVGRGAVNSKGPEMAQLNALMAYKAVNGKLPVNLIFVAEGDEERMDIGLRKFIKDHSDLLSEADALYAGGPSEGCVYVELTTSGLKWGRGPTVSDVHGVMKRTTDSPAWRHIHMLASLTSPDGNTPLIDGFNDNREYPTPEQMQQLKDRAAKTDLVKMAKNQGVARYMSDDPVEVLKDGRFGTSFNLDGIWGGNMYAGGAGAILPNKITSKHNFRYVPKMDGPDLIRKLRAQLDKNGYKDVDIKLIGDVPWSRGSSPTADISVAHRKAAELLGLKASGDNPFMAADNSSEYFEKLGGELAPLGVAQAEATGGYWPSYLFSDGEVGQKVGSVSIPMGMGARGGQGGRAHAANEYFAVEGSRWDNGMAGAEKLVAAAIYEYSQTTTTAPKPKTHAK
ncbi:Acetylornithine deacetylase/Succinyl-diaminopimelate desuccinylase [Bryocella elongata]|uniref:Acetylornithine deacetylase/Succinyl-diaminopimelate desuccinylase n=1 Tax=Bryocella elongata TaxID=863522 RepID=A0A1H5ZHB6_9BACT|nr:M20/M25/M40 family metallo-hydrolase [Bryocella elongata]SEG35027.1 Acetylornithine deacetylase/Succinyl-diaminopimelate desuccinylase [Bryocella elongata]